MKRTQLLDAIAGEHLPTQVGNVADLKLGQDPGENGEHADDLTV